MESSSEMEAVRRMARQRPRACPRRSDKMFGIEVSMALCTHKVLWGSGVGHGDRVVESG